MAEIDKLNHEEADGKPQRKFGIMTIMNRILNRATHALETQAELPQPAPNRRIPDNVSDISLTDSYTSIDLEPEWEIPSLEPSPELPENNIAVKVTN